MYKRQGPIPASPGNRASFCFGRLPRQNVASRAQTKAAEPHGPAAHHAICLQETLRLGHDLLHAAHIGTQNLGDRDGAVGILIVLQNGGHGAAGRQAGTVESVQVARTLEVLGVAILDVGAASLEVTAVGAGADLLVGCLLYTSRCV